MTMTAFSADNVIVGSAKLYIAPYGTELPDLTNLITDADGNPTVDWSLFEAAGYTDDGIELTYTATEKDIEVDEEAAPIDTFTSKEACTVAAKLSEATLETINRAIAASALSSDAETQTLKVGSAPKSAQQKFVIGLEGPAPGTNQTRVVLIYKARPTGAVGLKMQREGQVLVPVNFKGLADSSRALGDRLFRIVDFNSTAS